MAIHFLDTKLNLCDTMFSSMIPNSTPWQPILLSWCPNQHLFCPGTKLKSLTLNYLGLIQNSTCLIHINFLDPDTRWGPATADISHTWDWVMQIDWDGQCDRFGGVLSPMPRCCKSQCQASIAIHSAISFVLSWYKGQLQWTPKCTHDFMYVPMIFCLLMNSDNPSPRRQRTGFCHDWSGSQFCLLSLTKRKTVTIATYGMQ